MERWQFEELIDCHGRALRRLLTWCVSPRTNGPLLGRLRRQFGKSVPMTLTMSGGCAFGGGSLNGKFNIDAADGSYEASGNGMLGILGIKPKRVGSGNDADAGICTGEGYEWLANFIEVWQQGSGEYRMVFAGVTTGDNNCDLEFVTACPAVRR